MIRAGVYGVLVAKQLSSTECIISNTAEKTTKEHTSGQKE